MKFFYQSRNKNGEQQSGIVEASAKEAALNLLQEYGLYVTFLEEEKTAPYLKNIKLFSGVSVKALTIFTRQLSILIKANVSLVESLRVMASQERKESFREKINEISEKVEEGTLFSQSLSVYPQVFSPFFIGIVKAGEASGRLSESLDYLANHLERDYNFRSKVLGAMIYPIFVLVVFIGVIILMLAFIIPQLSGILKESGQNLPWITKTVMALSDLVKGSWFLAPIMIVAVAFAVFRGLKTSQGKKFLDENALKIPIIGGFLKKIYITRLAENLSTLISSGLPIIQAIEISRDVLGNNVFKEAADQIVEGVKKGEPISSVLFSRPDLFPAMFSQMVMVGEKTGSLDKSLLSIVDFYQKEVERSLDALIGLLEPLMIIGLAAMVLVLMGAVLLPIYQLGTI